MIYTAVLSLLSLVSQICLFCFVLFCFLNYPSKLRRENKEIRSGGLWFSYKYIAVLKFATHKKWTKSVSRAKSTGPLLRRKASAFRKVHNKVFVKSLRDRFCSCSLLVKADIRFTDINTFNFPVFIWKFFIFGSVGNNDIIFPRCSLKKIFVRLKMNYLTSIQVK